MSDDNIRPRTIKCLAIDNDGRMYLLFNSRSDACNYTYDNPRFRACTVFSLAYQYAISLNLVVLPEDKELVDMET